MNKFQDLFFAMKLAADKSDATVPPIPLFSFEGLPGAGKTTQIQLVAEALEKKYGKIYYIDLPTQSSFGRILKTLYKNQDNWECIRKELPWLNPLFLSVDLRESIRQAVAEGAKCALMSRGIVSTYYYNLDAFQGVDFENRWGQMEQFMHAFYSPSVIIFMDISEQEANKRVTLRNRGPLRKMDQIEQMKKDKLFLQECLLRLPNVPVERINAEDTPENVTKKIISIVAKYLEIQ